MQVVAFVEPPQGGVTEKILRHCGLWHAPALRTPPDGDALAHDLDGCTWDSQTGSSDRPWELPYVDIDTFLAIF